MNLHNYIKEYTNDKGFYDDYDCEDYETETYVGSISDFNDDVFMIRSHTGVSTILIKLYYAGLLNVHEVKNQGISGREEIYIKKGKVLSVCDKYINDIALIYIQLINMGIYVATGRFVESDGKIFIYPTIRILEFTSEDRVEKARKVYFDSYTIECSVPREYELREDGYEVIRTLDHEKVSKLVYGKEEYEKLIEMKKNARELLLD